MKDCKGEGSAVRPEREKSSDREVASRKDHGRSLWPTAKRFSCVPSMFDNLGV